MGSSIKIRLVPSKNDKIYKPLPDYADLYILMNKLHFNSVNSVQEEEKTKVSELELMQHQTQTKIIQNHKEESSLNVLANCLEMLIKSIKKQHLNGKVPDIKDDQAEEFNKILQESDIKIKNKLIELDLKGFKEKSHKFLEILESNLKLINESKSLLNKENNNLISSVSKLETLKENINSSKIDIDSLEIALKNIKLND